MPMAATPPAGFSGRRMLDPARDGGHAIRRVAIRPPAVPAPLLARHHAQAEVDDPPSPTEPSSKAEDVGARRLLQRATMGWTQDAQSEIEAQGYHAWLGRQLHPASIDDFGLEAAIVDALPSLSMTPRERLIAYPTDDDLVTLVFELITATLFRAIYSPRQLYERMVVFWTDHFHIDILSDFGPWLKTTDEHEVVRPHALGTFPDLLRASARSPAMLSYLTNDTNVAGHPNENYAREIMELHTLGRDNGYTQDDVRAVARCFTGWGLQDDYSDPAWGRFRFDPDQHDDGVKVVLGVTLPAGGGISDGDRVLDILAMHPNTARFVGRKLLRYFWGYAPTETMVDKVADAYLTTGGDIRAMLRIVLRRFWMERTTPKLKRPFHLTVSAVRALGSDVQDLGYLLLSLYAAGHLPYFWSPPNGYPDSADYWSGYLLPRWQFAGDLLRGAPAPLRYEAPFLLSPTLAPWQITRRLDWLLADQTLDGATRDALHAFLGTAPDAGRVRDAMALALSAPEFQSY